MMKPDALTPNPDSNSPHSFCAAAAPPAEVFYVVQSTAVLGERDHPLHSDLYETRPQADLELVRLRLTAHAMLKPDSIDVTACR
jgi:hypothetical protein